MVRTVSDSAVDGQAPANAEELPRDGWGLFDPGLNILTQGKLWVLAEALDDDVAKAAILVDGGFVDLLHGLGELGT